MNEIRCPRHDEPLKLLATGTDGTSRWAWWGLCPHITRTSARRCDAHVQIDLDAPGDNQPDLFAAEVDR